MYNRTKFRSTSIQCSNFSDGETIENKVSRLLEQKESIKETTPLLYTERKAGVQAGTNVRTDKWEVATDAMTVVHKTDIAKRDGKGLPSVSGTNQDSDKSQSQGE